MVPRDTARALLTRVVGKLASDGSSPLVRVGAVEGLTILLKCTESHSVLKAMLPVGDFSRIINVSIIVIFSSTLLLLPCDVTHEDFFFERTGHAFSLLSFLFPP